jgi:hypothetical protein
VAAEIQQSAIKSSFALSEHAAALGWGLQFDSPAEIGCGRSLFKKKLTTGPAGVGIVSFGLGNIPKTTSPAGF